MRALLITEKPSLMRDIEKVAKKMNLPFTIDFVSFVGHEVITRFFLKHKNLDTLRGFKWFRNRIEL